MKFYSFLIGIVGPALLVNQAGAESAGRWRIGDEREIHAGLYIKLVAELQGWRIWREDGGKDAKKCTAVKPAKGIGHPEPESATMFKGGHPALAISETTVMDIKRIDWHIHGTYYRPSTQEYRLVGDRYFTKRPSLFDSSHEWEKITELDSMAIEVHATSWQYPAISVGFADDRGVVDLTGLSAAITAMKACNLTR